jgi:hypothetical protein
MTEYAKTAIWQSHEIGLPLLAGVKWQYLSKILGYIRPCPVAIIPIGPN